LKAFRFFTDLVKAAPFVAGVLANFLTYNPVPFNTDDHKVAAKAKNFLQDTANWQRKQDVKVIWNLVTKADNPPKGEPIAQKPDTSGPAPTSAPYAPGTCSLDLNQTKTDNTDKTGEYLLEPLITDNSGAQIGYTEPEAITPDHPLGLQSKLKELLKMSPIKDHHGSVKFALGQQMWDTTQNDAGKIPYCEKTPNGNRKEYKCKFICGWGGGKSSDGSN